MGGFPLRDADRAAVAAAVTMHNFGNHHFQLSYVSLHHIEQQSHDSTSVRMDCVVFICFFCISGVWCNCLHVCMLHLLSHHVLSRMRSASAGFHGQDEGF